MIEPTPANLVLMGYGKLKKDTPYLLYKNINFDKLYLKKSGNSPIQELSIPDGYKVHSAEFVNFNQSSNLQQIIILANIVAELPVDYKNRFFLINEDLELTKISQIDGKAIHNILAIMDFDIDGLMDILYFYDKRPELYGMLFGNGDKIDNISTGNLKSSESNIVLDFNNDGLCDIVTFNDNKPVLCQGYSNNGSPDFGRHLPLLNENSSNLIRVSASNGNNYLICWSGNGLKSIAGDNGYAVNNVLCGTQIEQGVFCKLKIQQVAIINTMLD